MYNLYLLEIIIIQRAKNLGRIRFDCIMTQQRNDGWLKEPLENGLSIAVSLSRVLDVPAVPDRMVDMNHVDVGPAAVSRFTAFLVHFLFVQILSVQNHSCAM